MKQKTIIGKNGCYFFTFIPEERKTILIVKNHEKGPVKHKIEVTAAEDDEFNELSGIAMSVLKLFTRNFIGWSEFKRFVRSDQKAIREE